MSSRPKALPPNNINHLHPPYHRFNNPLLRSAQTERAEDHHQIGDPRPNRLLNLPEAVPQPHPKPRGGS
ncbi:hypothetical protein LINGRAPRIM_LOCUS551 [Linum grandiflorum]